MYKDNKISLVIPAYNESRLIVPTLKGVPPTIDVVFVVDDNSNDGMDEVVRKMAKEDTRIRLIRHETNKGPGAGIITGYKESLKENCDIAVVVGGDNQMLLDELPRFLEPLVQGWADYTKGNRFMARGNAFADMPKIRLMGNTIISLLTKISSGYYHLFDVVDGYTAINKRGLELCDWDHAWTKYGYPMDFLMRLNVAGMRTIDVPRTAVYIPGERQSQIKGFRYALSVSPMLFRNFLHRLLYKYVFSNFHPLIFLFAFGIFAFLFGLGIGIYILAMKFYWGVIPSAGTAVFSSLFLSLGVQSIFFAMLFDMQEGFQAFKEGTSLDSIMRNSYELGRMLNKQDKNTL